MTSSAQTARRPARPVRPTASALLAEVHETQLVTPNMRRVTLGGPALADFTVRGADQWFRLFLPRDGQRAPQLPVTTNWWPETLDMPEDTRPLIRNYTVRAARPELAEIDVDFVLHGDEGPGSAWANRAQPGDLVGILDQGVSYDPPPTAEWHLVIGDETALPAVAGILETVPGDTHVTAFVELPSAADAQPVRTGDNAAVTWLPRTDGADPGSLVVDAVRAAKLPTGEPYVWMAGESAMVRTLRRHLVRDRRVPKSAIRFSGYWRHGVSYGT